MYEELPYASEVEEKETLLSPGVVVPPTPVWVSWGQEDITFEGLTGVTFEQLS